MEAAVKSGLIGIDRKVELDQESVANALFLCADALFYPESDFFELLDELGIGNLCEPNKTLEDYQSEYISLFEANHRGIECVPFASWWYDRRLMGNEAIKLKRFYESCGFKFNEKTFKMPWDHVAIELSFLANLIVSGKCSYALKMIDNHLGWLEKFRECLKAKSSIYSTIVGYACELIKLIRKEEICQKE